MLSYLCKYKSYRRLSIMERKSNHFSGQLGFVLAAAGSAVGVGNLWRFPYLAAKDGGGLFLIIYFILVLTFGFTLLTSDIAIGRRTQKSAIGAYAEMKPKWKFLGILTFLVPVLIMTYYAVIGGWITKYAVVYLTGQAKAAAADDYFTSFITSSTSPVIFALIFMGVTAFIVYNGVQDGIEKVSKWMMPVLLVLVVIISIYSLTLKHTDSSGQIHTGIQGFLYYLTPNLEGLTVQRFLQILLDAMSQLFFSLSVSMGIMITYGSYVKNEVNLNKATNQIEIFDTGVAFLAGMMIIPAVFVFLGTDGMASGPSLIFITLPNIFNHIPLGRLWGSLFFIFMSFAAFSAILAVFENIISCGMELTGWSRKKSSLVNAIAIILLSLPCVLGYNVWSWDWLKVFGGAILDLEDFLVSNILLPLGSLVYLLFCVSKRGWGWKNFTEEANTGKGLKIRKWMRGYITYILPLIILFIFFFGLYDKFFA